ncbi:hypothetical protein BOX15_Mlig011180g1, partial [Macrostomum lignano]
SNKPAAGMAAASCDECAVCLSPMVHPVSLPVCPHRFCFLCIKGAALRSMRCPLCRSRIPADFFARPRLPQESAAASSIGVLVASGNAEAAAADSVDCASDPAGSQCGWYYEGRNGWWQFEERHCAELEAAYNRSEPCCSLVIFGYAYVVDFALMVQQRQDDASKVRRVKRGFGPTDRLKGVAGLAMPSPTGAAASAATVPSLTATAVASAGVAKPAGAVDDDGSGDSSDAYAASTPSSSPTSSLSAASDSSVASAGSGGLVNVLNSSLRQVRLSQPNSRQPPQGHG